MVLPKKDEKAYLEVTDRPGGFAIVGHKEHIDELGPLFKQNGLDSRWEAVSAETASLVFDTEADRDKVTQILEEYKNAKGS